MLSTFFVLCYFAASDGKIYQEVCHRPPTKELCVFYANEMNRLAPGPRPAKCVEHVPNLREVR